MASPANAAQCLNFWYLLITVVTIPRYAMLNSPQSVVSGQPTTLFCNYTFNTSFITDSATVDGEGEVRRRHTLCALELQLQLELELLVAVSSDRKPVLNEDCEQSPAACQPDGTFVMQLSMLPRQAGQAFTFAALVHFYTDLGHFNLTESGQFRFRPARNRHGKTAISLPVNVIGTNCTTRCDFHLHVVAQPDAPNLFVLSSELKLVGQHPSSITAATAADSDWLMVEQKSESNAAYRDLQFVFGAFDSDYDSDGANSRGYYLSARILSRPQFGRLFIEQSYEFLGTVERAESAANNAACQSPNEAFQLYECLPYFVLGRGYSERFKWMFTTLRYQPYETYIGADSFEIAVEKSMRHGGTQFYRTRVLIAVMENLCENNSTCIGHVLLNRDLQCKSPLRRTGFDRLHYRCLCTSGWIGSHCEKQLAIEDSPSSLRPIELTDTTDGYLTDQQVAVCSCQPPHVCSVTNQCECPSYDPSCDDQSIKSWQIAMIVVFSGIIVVCVTVAIILYSQKGNSFFK